MLRVLRDRCGTLSLPGIELHDVIGGLAAAADRALALSPHLERLAFSVSSLGPEIHTLAVRLPRVKLCVTVDHVEDRAALGELPNLVIFSRDGS
jgi:hypothetical protein